MASISCYGAANLDRTARCIGDLVLRSSNPVTTREAVGGVARNVAVDLVRLGHSVRLTAAVGTDAGGTELVNALNKDGVDTGGVIRLNGMPTPSYTAVLDRDGELLIGLADMAIYDRMEPAALEANLAAASHEARFVDANLRADCLAAATEYAEGTLLAASTVSTPKALRLLPVLDRLDIVFANRAEASALSGIDIQNPDDAIRAGAAIRGRGAKTVFITLGPSGAVGVGTGGNIAHPAIPGAARDVVGAGDAFAAGALSALVAGKPLADATVDGLAAASITIEVDGPTADILSADLVAARAQGAYGAR